MISVTENSLFALTRVGKSRSVFSRLLLVVGFLLLVCSGILYYTSKTVIKERQAQLSVQVNR